MYLKIAQHHNLLNSVAIEDAAVLLPLLRHHQWLTLCCGIVSVCVE